MAKANYSGKISRNGRKFSYKSKNTITNRDIKQSSNQFKHDQKMAALQLRRDAINNDKYQKQLTTRILGAETAGTVAAPATAAVANTETYADGGFSIGSDDRKDQKTPDSILPGLGK